jgi:serine/threonine protein kinase
MIAAEHRLALPAGYQLGKYRFKGLLGAGGFGITYLADDHSLGRRVAIKELLPNDIATRLDGTTVVAKTKTDEGNLAWARERFVEEGRALAACEHPNVVHVYEMVEANGTAYMVTKFEEGRSFAEWLTGLGRKPTEAELRGLLLPILSGLEKVHRAGFLHRDLKPENIYITDDGRPLLLDFGSARQAITDRTAMLTSIVTIGYAPFEQYYEDGKQGPWSDIYALSAVMYRAIHGEKPPEATRRLKNDSCLKLAKTYSQNYSADFLSAIDLGLAMEYKDRPQTVAAWRAMFQSGVVEQREHFVTPVPKPSPLEPVIQFAKQRPLWAAGGGAIVLGAVILAMIPAKHVPSPVGPTPAPTPVAIATPAPTPQPTAQATPAPSTTADSGSTTPGTWPLSTPTVSTVATPAPQPHLKPNPWTSPDASPAPKNSSPDNNDAPAVEHKLVGVWSAKITNASGYVTLHWDQKEDGHYSLSRAGEVIDSGTLTAADGQMHRVSETTQQEADLTYALKSSRQLVTTDSADSNGPITWTRISKESSGDSSKESSSTHHHSGGSSHSNGGGSGWHIPIPIRIPRLPF